MKRVKRSLRTTSILAMILVHILASTSYASAAPDNATVQPSGQHAAVISQVTEDDEKWMEENMVRTKTVLPNKIGLQRANEVRKKKGLKALDIKAAEIGEEVVPETASLRMSAASIDPQTAAIAPSDLGSFVDNSTLPYFPPIRSQGSIGSCASFAGTYYQATHMTAMARGWNTKSDNENSNKFSPKWTYNFLGNGEQEGGSMFIDVYRLFIEQGIATWQSWEYDDNYTDWPADQAVWEEAHSFKPDKVGYIDIGDGTDTPVESEKDEALTGVKQLLSNGYVLCFSTYINSWEYKSISENEAVSSDDDIVGDPAGYMVRETSGAETSHGMTIVGYNDDIWVDINGNSDIDPGEKGAFKVANSWGDWWRTDGFVWLCYDALNRVSSVKGCEGLNKSFALDGLLAQNRIFWMTAKPLYNPSLLADINLSHPKRNQLQYQIGYSEINETNPVITWTPYTLNDTANTGSQAVNGTVMFDYTNIIAGKDLTQSPKKWYIKITDTVQDGNKGVITGFKIKEPPSGVEVFYSPTPINIEVDGSSVTLAVQYMLGSQNTPASQWTYKKDIPVDIEYRSMDLVNCNGKIYLFGRNPQETNKGLLLEYNVSLDQWSVYDNNFPVKYDNAVYNNGNIYFVAADSTQVYNLSSKSWNYSKQSMPEPRFKAAVVEYNGKIYTFGGNSQIDFKNTTATNTVYQYNITNNTWTSVQNMQFKRTDPEAVVLNGKIYVFGGFSADERIVESVEEYDPALGTWSSVSSLPNILQQNCILKAKSLNDKIYIFQTRSEQSGSVFEYAPVNNTWTEKDSTPSTISSGDENFGVEAAGNKIYAVPAKTRNVLEFDPSAPGSTVIKPIKVEYGGGEDAGQTSEIRRTFRITNTGNAMLNLSDVKLRYYYTIDGIKPQNFYCDTATIDTSLINGTFVTPAISAAGSDTYLEIGFDSNAGEFQPGSSIELGVRFSKEDNTNYTQTNDYSFTVSPVTPAFKEWDKVAAYINGELMWGLPPAVGDTKVLPPVFGPDGGTYSSAQEVTMSSGTRGAVIRYTTDGSIPNSSSPVYTGPITISQSTTIKAIASFKGMTDSEVATASYSILPKVEKPTFGPIPSRYIYSQEATINCGTDGAVIKYTTDGTTPGPDSLQYTVPIMLMNSTTIKAIAFKDDMIDSSVSTACYEILLKVGDVTGDGYVNSFDLLFLKNYLMDNSTDIDLWAGDVDNSGKIDSFDYLWMRRYLLGEIDNFPKEKLDQPVFSIAGGTYSSPQTVTLSNNEPGSIIRYTTDGTEPSSASPIYTGPIQVSAGNITIKAKTVKSTFIDSDTVTESYIVTVGTLNIKAYNEQIATLTNGIQPSFKIENTGQVPVNLSDVKVRYYFTIDGTENQNFYCNWASIGSENVMGEFVNISPAKDNADCYLEVSFKEGAGQLNPGESAEVRTRFSKQDWSNYTQSNDYSFDSVASNYVDSNKLGLFMFGVLMEGTQP